MEGQSVEMEVLESRKNLVRIRVLSVVLTFALKDEVLREVSREMLGQKADGKISKIALETYVEARRLARRELQNPSAKYITEEVQKEFEFVSEFTKKAGARRTQTKPNRFHRKLLTV